MNLVNLRIGAGPDFVMIIGKIIYSHRAVVNLAFNNGATTRETLSHMSLYSLFRDIRYKLWSIRWQSTNGVNWIPGEKIAGDAKGILGLANVRFKFPIEMTADQRILMLDEIKRLFK